MDCVRLGSPALLLLVAPVWAALWYAAVRRPRRPGAAVRATLTTLATGLLVTALADPSVRLAGRGACPVVLLHDASPSMTVAQVGRDPAAVLAPWTSALPPRTVTVLPFADGMRTDLAAALGRAAAALPAGQGLVVLYTDARETVGDAAAQAARLAAAGIPVHAIAPDLAGADVAIASVRVPASPAPDRPFHVTVRLAATASATAEVCLARAAAHGEPARDLARTVPVSPGSGATVLFAAGPLPAGRYRYDISLAADPDACPANNRASVTVAVGGHRDIWYVHTDAEAGPLASALRRAAPSGVRLATRHVADGPPPADAAAIILDNVPAWSLGHRGAERLAGAVASGGLGLLVVGGDTAFAAGAYGDSPIDALLPVTSRLATRPPLDLVLVLDASGSMNETVAGTQKLALAKRAVLALRPALDAGDRVGIVAFAGDARAVSPLVPLDQWAMLCERLVALVAGGGTRITPAVDTALAQFDEVPDTSPATVRHVLLLSDGRSDDFAVDRLIREAGGRRVSLSAVATGADAQADRLGRLASETGGRLYAGADPARLADTFLADMIRARGEGLRRQTRSVRWVRREPVWPASAPAPPTVSAINLTRLKDGADPHWVTQPPSDDTVTANERPSPLLATWRRGLGKVAAMPWPAGAGPDPWLAGPSGVRCLRPLLAWLTAEAAPRTWSADLERRGDAWTVRVSEPSPADGPPRAPFRAAVLTDDNEPRRVTLRAVGPGQYEANVGPLGGGATVTVYREGVGARVRLTAASLPPLELQRLGVDRERLAGIVRAGGGRVHVSPTTLAEVVHQVRARGYRPVWRVLVAAAGVAVLVLAVLRLLGRA